MNLPAAREQSRMIFRTEWNQFFHDSRSIMIVPVLCIGIFIVIWSDAVAPFLAAVAIAVFPAMEIQFNNLLYRSPFELDALGLFPLRWRNVVLAKNLAAIALTLAMLFPATVILGNFSPSLTAGRDLVDLFLYFGSVIFPLVEVGNIQALQNPRRVAGWRYEDMMELLWMVFTLLITSIPAIVIMDSGYGSLPLLGYSVLTALHWWYRSVPATARKLEREFALIVERA